MWQLYLGLSASMWAIHLAFIKVAADKLPAAQVSFIFYLAGLATTLVLLGIERNKIDTAALAANPRLLAVLIGAGITIGLTDYFFTKGLAFGADISTYTPLFSTIGFVLITLIGMFWFGEALTATKVAGIVLCAAGFFLLVR